MTIRSPQALRLLLDRIMSGLSWKDAMSGIGARSEGAGWTWKHKSKEAQEAGDTSSIFYLDWPVGSEKQWFHILCDVARDRRGALLAMPLLRGEFAIVDGTIAFERDDFGGIVLNDLGVPVVERVAIVEPPAKGMHRPDPDAMRPRRPLAPSSYGGNKPKIAAPPYVGNALGDYIKASKTATITKQPMTALERDLRERLAAGPKNSKPNSPVTILGRDRGPPENISRPSDQTGLPQTAEVSREPSRPAYVKPPRLDGATKPPPGGFRVR
jgi:hypothetical protein